MYIYIYIYIHNTYIYTTHMLSTKSCDAFYCPEYNANFSKARVKAALHSQSVGGLTFENYYRSHVLYQRQWCHRLPRLPLQHRPLTTDTCVAVRCITLQCVALCCSALQCVAVCCSVLQYVAVCWDVLCRVLLQGSKVSFLLRRCVAVWCSVLHFVAVC